MLACIFAALSCVRLITITQVKVKNIEIKGFKSFPDKTVLHFDQGITGVVGPNGCGKSNIVDAIRWVVGEQKISSLRSENLENLVFNGSKTRSPSGLAEVSITFENTRNLLATEFNTVTITRRFYRTGESEYRLNNVVCRLKDIQNLLLDTGISSDSYAIIELGMIDDIIRDKDSSRRKMLEQAAGISIFKTRKRETQLKLQATEQDLARLEDVLYEINNQLKDLETQARRAVRYIDTKKKYKEVSILFAKLSLAKIQHTYQDYTEQQQLLTDKINQVRTEWTHLDALLEKDKLDFVQQEQSLRQMQQKVNQLERIAAETQNKKNLNEQQLIYNRQRIKEINTFIEDANKQIKYLEESIVFTQKSIQEETQTSEKFSITIEEKRGALEHAKNMLSGQKDALSQLINHIQQAQSERFELEKQNALYEAQRHNTSLSINERQAQQTSYAQALSENQTQLHQLSEQLTQHEQHHKERTETSTQLKNTILHLQQTLEAERVRLADIQRQRDAKQNEYDLVKNLIDTLEGYPDSVKYLHKNAEWEQSPLLSDVISVKDEFRVAIERFLEPYMNYYVVAHAGKVSTAIHLLKKNQKGKVNFFTIDNMPKSTATNHARPANCFPALDVVEIEPSFEPVVHHLLNNVFIYTADSEDIIQEAGCAIISKDGTWVSQPISISGGSLGNFEGSRIGRKKNLEKIHAHIQTLQQQIDQQSTHIAQLQQNINDANHALNENSTEQVALAIMQTKERIRTTENTIQDLHTKTAETNHFLAQAKQTIDQIHQSLITSTEQLSQYQKKENELKASRSLNEKKLQDDEHIFQAKQTDFNDTQIQFTKHQNKVATLQNDLHYKQSQLDDLKRELQNRQSELSNIQINTTQAETLTKEMEDLLLSQLKEREEASKLVATSEQAVDNNKNHILEQEKVIRSLQIQKEKLEQEDFSIKEKFTAIQLEIASIKERLLLEFKIDIEEYLKNEDLSQVEGNVQEVKEQVEKLKRSIENLGDVNPMAVEAFETHQKRYNFIIQQKADLVAAKDNLVTTIHEVEQTVNQNFIETFNLVRSHFQNVFKKLFTEEDTADLVLDQPNNFAETGIDIVAKPKGKRPASINQLSGGEKTLTSIALLFSLYLIKPAPFCVMDEVDAPLDDANVSKFTKMVREFSKESQFIIVTHNKSTMAAVDTIYGVTMQETGVSKIVPVDFRSLAS